MNYDFKIAEHEETGHIGLQALFMEGAEPRDGHGCAHDIMEHFRGLELNSNTELMAIGAMLHVRGEGGFFRSNMFNNCPGYIIYGDIVSLKSESYKWGEITSPGRTTRINDEEIEYWIEKGINKAAQELRDNWETHVSSEWRSNVRGWLRKGYRKAYKRYPQNPFTLTHIFKRMTEKIDHAFKHAENHAIVRVSFVIKTGECTVRNINIWESDHPDYEPMYDDWD